MKKLLWIVWMVALALPLSTFAQHEHHDMANMDMGKPDAAQNDEHATAAADDQMSHHHMDMGPHMKMTPLRPATKADEQRATVIAKQTRSAIEKYTDVKVAEADGYRLFAPKMKHQKMFHYTNYRYAMEAAYKFDAEHPTSLLYQDDGHGGKKLIGAMFTAPKNATPAELEERVPLSVAQWHAHVNLCMPPRSEREQLVRDAMAGKKVKFGLTGSIATREECDAAGGTFMPQ